MDEQMILIIKDFLIKKVDPDFIMLFGSYATGDNHPSSDVDLAFYKSDHGLSAYDVFILAGELASLIKIDVDLIDLMNASTVFKMQIFEKGNSIYTKDFYSFNIYEMTVFRMYLDLNEKRNEVLKEIHESGSVYGTRLRYREK